MVYELKVKSAPKYSKIREGEVRGKTIYIYEEDEAKAVDTLRHEFIEYALAYKLVAPYKKMINKLISLFEEEIY